MMKSLINRTQASIVAKLRRSNAGASKSAPAQCNYRDDYYGDQLCIQTQQSSS
mgnify:CR=1 FL=1